MKYSGRERLVKAAKSPGQDAGLAPKKGKREEGGLGEDSLRSQCSLVRPQGVARPLGQPEAPVSRLSLEGTSEWHTSLADMVASDPSSEK